MQINRAPARRLIGLAAATAVLAMATLAALPVQASGLAQGVLTSTPQADGSIEHIVGPGETLWTIAAIYGIDLNELLALNGYTDTPLLFEGDRVLIQPPHTATPTDAPAPTATATVPPPTVTPTEPATETAPTATASPVPAAAAPSELPIGNILIVAGAGLVVAGLGLAIRDLRQLDLAD